MARDLTPQYIDAQTTKARLAAVHIDYDNEAVAGGFVRLEYLDASDNVIEMEKVRFTPAQFGAWDGSVAQARNFAIARSAKLRIKP